MKDVGGVSGEIGASVGGRLFNVALAVAARMTDSADGRKDLNEFLLRFFFSNYILLTFHRNTSIALRICMRTYAATTGGPGGAILPLVTIGPRETDLARKVSRISFGCYCHWF